MAALQVNRSLVNKAEGEIGLRHQAEAEGFSRLQNMNGRNIRLQRSAWGVKVILVHDLRVMIRKTIPGLVPHRAASLYNSRMTTDVSFFSKNDIKPIRYPLNSR